MQKRKILATSAVLLVSAVSAEKLTKKAIYARRREVINELDLHLQGELDMPNKVKFLGLAIVHCIDLEEVTYGEKSKFQVIFSTDNNSEYLEDRDVFYVVHVDSKEDGEEIENMKELNLYKREGRFFNEYFAEIKGRVYFVEIE